MAALITVQAVAAEPIEVFAGIPPAAYLVERIGGDRVHVEVLIQPGQDPHTFEPAPKQIQALGKAKVIFKTGMPFENQLLEKIRGLHLRLAVADTTEGMEKRRLSPEHVGRQRYQVRGAIALIIPPKIWIRTCGCRRRW